MHGLRELRVRRDRGIKEERGQEEALTLTYLLEGRETTPSNPNAND